MAVCIAKILNRVNEGLELRYIKAENTKIPKIIK